MILDWVTISECFPDNGMYFNSNKEKTRLKQAAGKEIIVWKDLSDNTRNGYVMVEFEPGERHHYLSSFSFFLFYFSVPITFSNQLFHLLSK